METLFYITGALLFLIAGIAAFLIIILFLFDRIYRKSMDAAGVFDYFQNRKEFKEWRKLSPNKKKG